jgi:hypothetical protein
MNSTHSTGKIVHRTPVAIDNPEVKSDKDWWDDLCKAHGAKNFWPNKKTKQDKQRREEKKILGESTKPTKPTKPKKKKG